ncbi:MAG: formate dehydrogenase accessory protein FdhE [bacterium]
MIGYAGILEGLRGGAALIPESAETVLLHAELIEAQRSAVVRLGNIPDVILKAAARLESGFPALSPESFQADPGALARLSKRICEITARHRSDLAGPLHEIDAWLAQERVSMCALAAGYLREGRIAAGEAAGLDGTLLAFSFNHTVHPFLREYAGALAPLPAEAAWQRPFCPICAGEPDFASLARGTGSRRLLCSRCDTEWAFGRVGCPFCGCDDPARVKYSLTEVPACRIGSCDRCGRYLKTIDLREADGERLLPVERILTVHLDLAAREAGYT